MTVKVTVVVPTYNSGKLIEPLIDSMLRQSLPPEEFEVLFVDDGSKDDTPALLEGLAAEHEHFRVVRIPNSGWPGKPRNVGVEQARGEYVQFLDHDDRMAPQALERLYETARRNGSDIVIGKAASNFTARGVAHALMSRARESCTVWNAPLVDSLTPHKMFRTAFLRENQIVHPEGPWILEDQLFMVRSYLKAAVVSIPGDHVSYYYWAREDEGNSGARAFEPREYYGNLREVMRTVVDGTEPGPQRDRLLRRFYRGEMLSRLGVPARGVTHDPPFTEDPFEVVRELAEEFVTDGVHDGMNAGQRIRSTLLRQNRQGDLAEFTRRQYDLKARSALEGVSFGRERVRASFTARFEEEPGGPGLVLARRGDRYYYAPALTEGVLDELVDVTDELKSFKAEVQLRHTETAHLWALPQKASLDLQEEGEPDAEGTVLVRPVVRGVVAVDPRRAAGGGPLEDGVWELRIRLTGAGFDRYARLGESRAEDLATAGPEVVDGRAIRPVLAEDGLSIEIAATDAAPAPRGPKVSVVLPTAGAAPEAVQETLASLAAQSLPAADVEVVEVDASAVPSGADPRNAGIDAAGGQYVLFMEAGDRLAPEALERMYAYGMEHDADVVAGKLAGKGRAVPRELFVRDRPDASLAKDPLADSLTANKLFHRDLLAAHGLRFPEGGRPLAEQEFTVVAYLRALRTAVLGSYVCYHYGPAKAAPAPAWSAYYTALRTVLETANRLSEPGPARDRLHRRWLRVEMLDRLSGKRLLELDEEARRELFQEIRTVLAAGVSDSAIGGLPVSRRLAVGLIADDRLEDLVALAAWEDSVAGRVRLDELSWQQGDLSRQQGETIHLAFEAELHAADGPVGVAATSPGQYALAPAGLPQGLLDRFAGEPLTGGAAPGKATAVLVLRERGSGAEYRLRTETTVRGADGDSPLTVRGTARLDPATAVGGAPLGDGVWDLSVRLSALGWTKSARLGARRGPQVPEELAAIAHPTERDRRITPYWTKPHGDLSLRVAVPKPPKPAPAKPTPKPSLLRRVVRRLRRG
ncbi:glycosyltransferase [Streptomyces sp. NPDC051907]|uniref:glycosyltransferase n=1 Tax=Streptomyces sp. NPDC051907 TaxID=3155284 RepID=UPI00344395D1